MTSLGPEPSLEAASRRSLAAINAMIAATQDPWHRAMFSNWRDHYWAEVMGDLKGIMATLAPDPVYRFYGSDALGDTPDMNATADVRAMYGGFIAMGFRPAGPVDDLIVAFSDAHLMLQFRLTCIYPGAVLKLSGGAIDPAAAYRVTLRVSESHPYDKASGLMGGETVFLSAPEEVVRVER